MADHDLVWASAVAAVPACIAALAALANGRRSKNIENRLKDGNGDESNIGELVYGLKKDVEVVIAKQHETSGTVAAMRDEYLERFERLEKKAPRIKK